MTSVQVQPSNPPINLNSEQPFNKKIYLLIQPTTSKFMATGHASTTLNALSKIDRSKLVSNFVPGLSTNVYVSDSNCTKPSAGTSPKTNFPTKTSNHEPITTNKFQQLLLPINHFIIAENLNQTNLQSKSQTDMPLECGKNEVQQICVNDSDKNDEKSETDSSKDIKTFCSICDLRFKTKELLDLHLEGTLFSCRICFSEFSTHTELGSHILSHPNYKCVQCKEVFLLRKDLYHHRKDVTLCNPKVECITCQKKYISSKSLILHQKTVHSHGEARYKCVVCGKMCLLPNMLRTHQKRTHVVYERMKCKLCNVFCLGPEKLKFHLNVCHLRKEETCPVPCPICGKVFELDYYLRNHINYTHNDTNDILCEYCGQACKGRRSLLNHISRNHNSLKKYKYDVLRRKTVSAICEICGKTLKSKYQLRTHLQIHSSERQFKCGVCNATFKQEVALRNHNTTHSSVCKYNCSNCGKSFKWKHSFKNHEVKCK